MRSVNDTVANRELENGCDVITCTMYTYFYPSTDEHQYDVFIIGQMNIYSSSRKKEKSYVIIA